MFFVGMFEIGFAESVAGATAWCDGEQTAAWSGRDSVMMATFAVGVTMGDFISRCVAY